MTTSHPYATQLIALWLSFLPFLGIGGLMVGAILRGNRGAHAKARVRISAPHHQR